MSNVEEINDYLIDRQSYKISKERQDDMEVFHERTKFYPSAILRKSMKIGDYMNFRSCVVDTLNNYKSYAQSEKIHLPTPNDIDKNLSQASRERVSIRDYAEEDISLQTLSDLLQGGLGVTRVEPHPKYQDLQVRKRCYASAGALFPIEAYPILLRVEGQQPCVTHYNPNTHQLSIINNTVDMPTLQKALCDFETIGNACSKHAAVIIVLTSVFQRAVVKYEERGYRFALLEAGAIGQQLSLASTGLGLGSLTWGGFYDDLVDQFLYLDGVNESIVNSLIIGKPQYAQESNKP